MEKSRYYYAKAIGKLLDAAERLAQAILYRRPFEGVTLEADHRYGERKREVVDFIYPSESSRAKRPILIYIHGGGFISGIKNMRRTHCYEYAKKGYFVANVDYELAPDYQFPVAVQECLSAIDFVYDNAKKYNLDTSKVLLAGESAGAYFAAMLSAIAKNNGVAQTLGLKLKHTEFDVTANIFNCGAFNIKTLAASRFPNMSIMVESFTNLTKEIILTGEADDIVKNMSPQNYIDESFPPSSFILYASHDLLRNESFAFKNRLDSLNVPNEIYKCKGILYGNHAFALSTVTKTGQIILQAAQKYVDKYIFD